MSLLDWNRWRSFFLAPSIDKILRSIRTGESDVRRCVPVNTHTIIHPYNNTHTNHTSHIHKYINMYEHTPDNLKHLTLSAQLHHSDCWSYMYLSDQ